MDSHLRRGRFELEQGPVTMWACLHWRIATSPRLPKKELDHLVVDLLSSVGRGTIVVKSMSIQNDGCGFR
jgi:hypothetical protein